MSAHKKYIFTSAQEAEIVALRKQKLSWRKIAELFGVHSHQTMWKIHKNIVAARGVEATDYSAPADTTALQRANEAFLAALGANHEKPAPSPVTSRPRPMSAPVTMSCLGSPSALCVEN